MSKRKQKSDESEPESPIRNLFRDLTRTIDINNLIDQSDESTDRPCNIYDGLDMNNTNNMNEILDASIETENENENLDNLYMNRQIKNTNQMAAESANQMNMNTSNAKQATSTPIRKTIKARKPSKSSTKTPRPQRNLSTSSTPSIKRFFSSTSSISESPKTHHNAEDRPSKKQKE